MPISPSEQYTRYCRPQLGDLLKRVRLDKTYFSGQGDYLYYLDSHGKKIKILDFLGGFGANLFGHHHPKLIAVAKRSLDQGLPFNAQASCRSQAARLGEKLCGLFQQRTGHEYVATLANSGAEAVEAALKHAEFYYRRRLETHLKNLTRQIMMIKQRHLRKPVIPAESLARDFNQTLDEVGKKFRSLCDGPAGVLCLNRAFHGKTSGAVQLTYNSLYRDPFTKFGLQVQFIDYPDPAPLQQAIENSYRTYWWPEIEKGDRLILKERKLIGLSCLFVEPLQGEGGIHPVPAAYLKLCRELTQQHGLPLVFDEIQCGMGRTGTFLYSEQPGVFADYYLLAKSLGGGLSKISALLVRRDLYEEEFGFIHTSTFAEDDHSAALALAAINLLEENHGRLYKNCRERGEQLLRGLEQVRQAYPEIIREVRGMGLMIGVQFAALSDSTSVILQILSEQKFLGYVIAGYLLHEQGLRVAPTLSESATIRLEPSAYIRAEDCRKVIEGIRRICEIIAKHNLYHLLRFLVSAERPGAKEVIEDYSVSQPKGIPSDPNVKQIGFIGHLIHARHLRSCEPGFALFSDAQLEELIEKLYPEIGPKLIPRSVVRSATGEQTQFNFIGLFLNSKIIARHMEQRSLKPIRDKIQAAVDLAREHRCQAVGFGGYTSIVTRNCKEVLADCVYLTTGNSLTVAMGLEAIRQAAGQMGLDHSRIRFAAVGAAGNIASVYSEIMAEIVPEIYLIGKPDHQDRLRSLAARIYANAFEQLIKAGFADAQGVALGLRECRAVIAALDKGLRPTGMELLAWMESEFSDQVPVHYTADYNALKSSQIILSASSDPGPIIFPRMLSPEPTLICDIAVPADVDESVSQACPHVQVIQGGVVKLPHNAEFQVAGIPLEPGELYACMAETLLMGLSDIQDHYSYGQIEKEQVKAIMREARKHGFQVSRVKSEQSY